MSIQCLHIATSESGALGLEIWKLESLNGYLELQHNLRPGLQSDPHWQTRKSESNVPCTTWNYTAA